MSGHGAGTLPSLPTDGGFSLYGAASLASAKGLGCNLETAAARFRRGGNDLRARFIVSFAVGRRSRWRTTTGQSAPLRRIGTFGLAVGAACAFSLGIAGQF